MPPQDTTPTKRCSKCGETKPLEAFYRRVRTKSGLTAHCKDCGRREAAAWRTANPERNKAAKAKCYWAKRDEYCAKGRARRYANLDRYEAQAAQYRARNRDRESRRAQRWHLDNPERKRQQSARWKRANPAKILQATRLRRARKAGAALGMLTMQQWALVLDYFGHACAYCGATGVALTQDHIVPLSRGGEHSAANVVPACRHCNSRKFARPLWRFLLERGHEHGLHS